MLRVERLRRLAICAMASLVMIGVGSSARAQAPVKAEWQVQEIFLSYLGFTSLYSCDGMRDRVAGWIDQLGARDTAVVSVAGCDQPTGPARMPSVRIYIATPVAEASAAKSADPKRAEILAKIQRKSKASLPEGSFDATRKSVVLLSKQTESPGAAGDCELLENFRDQVLKKIDAHIVKDNLGCTPHQGTVGNRSLEVEVLTKAKA